MILPKIESKEIRFVVSQQPVCGQLFWSCGPIRIYRRPLENVCSAGCCGFFASYQKTVHFAIGKSYYEPISCAAFDPERSRALIRFLEGLLSGDGTWWPCAFQMEAVTFTFNELLWRGCAIIDGFRPLPMKLGWIPIRKFSQELRKIPGLFSFQVVEMKEFINTGQVFLKWWKVAFFWQMAISANLPSKDFW